MIDRFLSRNVIPPRAFPDGRRRFAFMFRHIVLFLAVAAISVFPAPHAETSAAQSGEDNFKFGLSSGYYYQLADLKNGAQPELEVVEQRGAYVAAKAGYYIEQDPSLTWGIELEPGFMFGLSASVTSNPNIGDVETYHIAVPVYAVAQFTFLENWKADMGLGTGAMLYNIGDKVIGGGTVFPIFVKAGASIAVSTKMTFGGDLRFHYSAVEPDDILSVWGIGAGASLTYMF